MSNNNEELNSSGDEEDYESDDTILSNNNGYTQNYITTNIAQYFLESLYNTGQSVDSIFQENNNIQNVLNESLYTTPRYKNVITDEALQQIKYEKYNPSLYSNQICPITQIEFEENSDIAVLPCNHIYNIDAIKQWLCNEKAECPTCRYKFESKEIQCENNIQQPLHINIEQQPNDNLLYRNYIIQTIRNMIQPMQNINYEPSREVIELARQSRENNTIPISHLLERRTNLFTSMSRVYDSPYGNGSNVYSLRNRYVNHNNQYPSSRIIIINEEDEYNTQDENEQFNRDIEEAIRRSMNEN